MLTKNRIDLEKSTMKKLLNNYHNMLSKLPSGKLHTKIQHGKKRLFLRSNNQDYYVPKQQIDFLQEYTDSLVYKKLIVLLSNNIYSLNRFANNYCFYDDALLKNLYQDAVNEITDLIQGSCFDGIKISPRPAQIVYDQNTRFANSQNYPLTNPYTLENKLHRTPGGILVRSKSETAIATLLESYDIPYLYEHLLVLDNSPIYPDFTILIPNSAHIIWEHLGLWINTQYREKNIGKLLRYLNNGYRLGKNLIITYDEPDGSLDMESIERIIKSFI